MGRWTQQGKGGDQVREVLNEGRARFGRRGKRKPSNNRSQMTKVGAERVPQILSARSRESNEKKADHNKHVGNIINHQEDKATATEKGILRQAEGG